MTVFFRLVAVTIIIFLCYGGWVSYQASYYQTELGPQIRQQYGFSTGTPIIIAGGESIEVLAIYPEPGSFFELEGVKPGDIVLSTSLTGLYRMFHENTGGEMIYVTDGGDGPPINDRPTRAISLPGINY